MTPPEPQTPTTEAGRTLLNDTWTFEDEWQYEQSRDLILAIEAQAAAAERRRVLKKFDAYQQETNGTGAWLRPRWSVERLRSAILDELAEADHE